MRVVRLRSSCGASPGVWLDSQDAIVLYHSGVDVHLDDQVGGWLTDDELRERERLVFDAAIEHHLPLVWCMGGGYQRDSDGRRCWIASWRCIP